MMKDLKERMKHYQPSQVNLSEDHQIKFQQKLEQKLHKPASSTSSFRWQYAASILILIGLSLSYFLSSPESPSLPSQSKMELGNLSPDLKSIETYYVNAINYELSQINPSEDYKELVDGYLTRIADLTTEYKTLTKELNTKGVNESIINALIANLQLRLQLLQRMKKQLNDLQTVTTRQNEHQYF